MAAERRAEGVRAGSVRDRLRLSQYGRAYARPPALYGQAYGAVAFQKCVSGRMSTAAPPESPMPSLAHLVVASLMAVTVAACSSAPATPIADPVPPPRRPADAKTQLEYGNPPPPPMQRY